MLNVIFAVTELLKVLHLFLITSTHFVGFVIYFSYGIRNSAEAVMTSSETDPPKCTIKGEPMGTEKEAFFHNAQNATRDNDDDYDDDS